MKKTIIILAVLYGMQGIYAQQREDMNLKGERARLNQGIQSGEVTPREAKKARKEMRDVQQAKQSAKSDGIITPQERREIAHQDRQADRTIHRVKHNNRRR